MQQPLPAGGQPGYGRSTASSPNHPALPLPQPCSSVLTMQSEEVPYSRHYLSHPLSQGLQQMLSAEITQGGSSAWWPHTTLHLHPNAPAFPTSVWCFVSTIHWMSRSVQISSKILELWKHEKKKKIIYIFAQVQHVWHHSHSTLQDVTIWVQMTGKPGLMLRLHVWTFRQDCQLEALSTWLLLIPQQWAFISTCLALSIDIRDWINPQCVALTIHSEKQITV